MMICNYEAPEDNLRESIFLLSTRGDIKAIIVIDVLNTMERARVV